MNDTVCRAPVIPLHRPWWQRALDGLRAFRAFRAARGGAQGDDPYAELRHLSPETLRDIGMPEGVADDPRQRELWRLDRRNW